MFLLLQDIHVNASGAMSAAVIGVLGTWAVVYSATVRANGKSQGEIETKIADGFAQIARQVGDLKQTDRDQWKAMESVKKDVSEVREDVARIEGQIEGHMKAAAATAVAKVRGASAGGS